MNQEIRPGLTNIGHTFHNGVRGPAEFAGASHGVNFFMAEDQGEVPKVTPQVPKSAPGLKPAFPFPEPRPRESASHTAEEKEEILQKAESLTKLAGVPHPPKSHRQADEILSEEDKVKRAAIREWEEAQRLTKQVVGLNLNEDLRQELERQTEIEALLEEVANEELRRRLEDWRRPGMQSKFRDLEFLKEEEKAIREAILRPEAERRIPGGEAATALGFLDKKIVGIEEKIMEERTEIQRGAPRTYFSPEKLRAIEGKGEAAEKAREEIFEDLFARADATPGREFHDAFSMYYDEPVYRAFLDVLRKAGREADVTRYVAERELRETLHNANYVLTVNAPTETLVKFLQPFRSEMADLAFSKKGVATAFHMYEQALLNVIEEHGGYLPYEEVAWDPRSGIGTGKTEKLARDYLLRALESGQVRDVEGNVVRGMTPLEINRAITLARGLGIATLRTLEIASLSKLPPGRLASLYAQNIIRDLNPFTHLIGKFGIGKEKLAILGYLLEGKRQAWSQKELLDFVDKMSKDPIGVVEGKYGKRPLGIINPARTGSMFSNTTWRIEEREDPEKGPAASLVSHLSLEEKEWMGTGLRLEKTGDIKDPAKREERETIYQRIVQTQPLTLFLNIPEIQSLIRGEVLENIPQERRQEVFAQVKDDMVFLQEELFVRVQDKLRRGERVPFTPTEGEVGEQLDFSLLPAGGRRELAQVFTQRMRQRFIDDEGNRTSAFAELVSRKFPFVLGLTDAPLDKFQFIRSGGNGIARSLNDFGAESKAVVGTIKMDRRVPSYQKIEDLIADMHEIYEEISNYDEDKAREYILIMAEGFAKIYKKDWWARLPLFMGSTLEWVGARGLLPYRDSEGKWKRGIKASYAKTKFGNSAPSWDEEDAWNFTKAIEAAGMLAPEQIKKLRKQIGATHLHLLMAHVRKYGPGGIFSFAAAFFEYTFRDITK